MENYEEIPHTNQIKELLTHHDFNFIFKAKPRYGQVMSSPVLQQTLKPITKHTAYNNIMSDRIDNSFQDKPSFVSIPQKFISDTLNDDMSISLKSMSAESEKMEEKFDMLDQEIQAQFRLMRKANLEHKLPPEKTEQFQSEKKILILDLDETLMHVLPMYVKGDDKIIKNAVVEGSQFSFIERPFLQQFLTNISRYYSIVVFTAAKEEYASVIVKLIDPQQCIKKVYSSKHCVCTGEITLKDIRHVSSNLCQTIIVDNKASSFGCQLSNGIWIKSFYGNIHDSELLYLSRRLMLMKDAVDVRTVIDTEYGLKPIYEHYKHRQF